MCWVILCWVFADARPNLRRPVGLAALGQDLRGDGEHDLAVLVARLNVRRNDPAIGARLEVDLLGEAAAILQRVAHVRGLEPAEVAEPGRRPVGRKADASSASLRVALEAR